MVNYHQYFVSITVQRRFFAFSTDLKIPSEIRDTFECVWIRVLTATSFRVWNDVSNTFFNSENVFRRVCCHCRALDGLNEPRAFETRKSSSRIRRSHNTNPFKYECISNNENAREKEHLAGARRLFVARLVGRVSLQCHTGGHSKSNSHSPRGPRGSLLGPRPPRISRVVAAVHRGPRVEHEQLFRLKVPGYFSVWFASAVLAIGRSCCFFFFF